MQFTYCSYAILMLFYVNRKHSNVTCISFVCHLYVLVCHSFVTRMQLYIICIYSHVIFMSLLCTHMSSVCHSYVLVCNGISLVCTHMSSVYHSYVLVYHPYVTRMYSHAIRMSLVCTRMS